MAPVFMLQEYLEWKATYTRPNTAKSYKRFVGIFVDITAGHDPGVQDIIRYHSILQSRYSGNTISYGMAILRDFVGFYAKKKNWNITKDDVQIPRSRSRSHLPITEAEYVTMLTWIRPSTVKGLRDLVMLRMLYDTGCRISELVGCQAFDTASRMAKIDNAKRTDEGFIFWGLDTNTFLETYLAQRPKKVFPSVRQCERILHGYAKKAGINKHIVCHSFRHSKAWRVLDNGGSVKDVQSILRHRSPISSFRYLDWDFNKQRERAGCFLDK